MVLLGLMICAAGFLASLLPHLQEGLVPWSICLLIFVLYPLIFQRSLRENRADYEFRMLHWFPAGIMFFWALLEVFGPRAKFVHILQLGFLYLWSLPLVAMGLLFSILFAVHVIRRSALRVTVLSIFLVAFTAGAIAAEAEGWNPRLQAALLTKDGTVAQIAGAGYQALVQAFQRSGTGTTPTVVALQGSSASAGLSSSASSARVSSRSSSSLPVTSLSSSSRRPPTILADKKPGKLPKSGPESAGLIAVSLLGLYSAVLHRRARKRA